MKGMLLWAILVTLIGILLALFKIGAEIEQIAATNKALLDYFHRVLN